MQIKYVVYIVMSILFGGRGLFVGNPNTIAFATIVAFIGFMSAIVGVKTMNFEAKLFMMFYSLFDSLFSSEPKPRHRNVGAGGAGLRARPWPRLRWGRTARTLAFALVISLPSASLAMVVVVQPNLEPYTKVALILCIVSSIATPVALG